MSGKAIILVAAMGAVAFIVYQKTRSAPALAQSAPVPTRNVNGDMWSKILGEGAWKLLTGGALANGTQAFVMNDGYGRVTTSDGKPIGSGDFLTDWVSTATGLPNEYYADPYATQNMGLSSGFDALQESTAQFSDYQDNGGYRPSWQ